MVNKKIILSLFTFCFFACGPNSPWTHPLPPYPVVAPDEDPRYCSHEYPVDTTPDSCESGSAGDCCSWLEVETEEGTCRMDYCSYFRNSKCEWELQYKDCTE